VYKRYINSSVYFTFSPRQLEIVCRQLSLCDADCARAEMISKLLCVTVYSVTYLMTTMTLGTVSVCMTVLVLNIHHRGADTRISPWLRRLTLVHLARLVGVRTSALDAARGCTQPSSGQCQESSPPPTTTTTTSGILRRRASLRQEQKQRGGGGVVRQQIGNDSARMLSCHYVPLDGVANDVSADLTTTDNDVGTPKLAPADVKTLNNGPSSLGLRVPSLMMTYGRRWRRQQQQQQLQRHRRMLFDTTGSVVGDRLSRSGGDFDIGSFAGRSPPPSPPPRHVTTVHDNDDEETNAGETCDDRAPYGSAAGDSDVVVSEWTELARVLDRTFFWLLFALMTVSAVVILLYPKYTGNEHGWTASK